MIHKAKLDAYETYVSEIQNIEATLFYMKDSCKFRDCAERDCLREVVTTIGLANKRLNDTLSTIEPR